MGNYTIGEIASVTGVTVQTVRYYERRGLLPKASRSAGNYRLFREDAVLVVHFIQQVQTLGFTLTEIQELMALRSVNQASCKEIHDIASHKLATIDTKVRLLQRMRRVLSQQIAACSGHSKTQACPILEALGRPHEGARAQPRSSVAGTRRTVGARIFTKLDR